MWLRDFPTEHGDRVRVIADAICRPLVEPVVDGCRGGGQRPPADPDIVLIVAAGIDAELCAVAEPALRTATLAVLCCCPAEPRAASGLDHHPWLQHWIDAWFIGEASIAPLCGLLLEAACAGVGMRRKDSLLRALGGIGRCVLHHTVLPSSAVRRHRVRRLPSIDREILDAPNLVALVRGSVRRIDAVNAIHDALLPARRAGDLHLRCLVLPARHDGFALSLIAPAPHPGGATAEAAAAANERHRLRFPVAYLGHLRRFARLPGAADLLLANPALALALAYWPSFRLQPLTGVPTPTPDDRAGCARPTDSGRALIAAKLRAPQREVLAWLGFPGSDSVRRFLSGLAPECIDLERLLALRDCLRVPERFAKLRHTRPGTLHELRLLLEPRVLDRFSIGLLQQLQHSAAATPPGDWTHAAQLLLRRDSHGAPREFATRAALTAWAAQQMGARLLPTPPPDHAAAQRISSAAGLVAEGRAMQHCLGNANYQCLLDDGSALFYRVLKPVRATLMYQSQGALWVLAEIKGRKGRALRPGELAHCLRAMCADTTSLT